MQYKVDPMDQTWENGKKLVKTGHLVPMWRHYWMIHIENLSDNINKSWRLFSNITISNMKSIQRTQLQKMAKNLFFDPLDHSKMHFCDFWMIQHERYDSEIVKTI